MACINLHCSLFALIMAGILLSADSAAVNEGCQADLVGLITQCRQYVVKQGPTTPPSAGCCNVVKEADVPCACQYLTPEIEKLVSPSKVVFVAAKCGRPMAKGSKCGSLNVPMA